jgi:phage shock protein E
MEHSLTSEEVGAIKSGKAYLIDVRSAGEVAATSCPSAMHWDVQQMVEGRFPAILKNVPVFVFCRSGSRSATAQRLLGANGFSDAHNVGGFDKIPKELF